MLINLPSYPRVILVPDKNYGRVEVTGKSLDAMLRTLLSHGTRRDERVV